MICQEPSSSKNSDIFLKKYDDIVSNYPFSKKLFAFFKMEPVRVWEGRNAFQTDDVERAMAYLNTKTNTIPDFEDIMECIYDAVNASSLKVLRAIIQSEKISLRRGVVLGFKGVTLFPYAIMQGKVDVLQFLLEQSVELQPMYRDFHQNNLFHIAAFCLSGEDLIKCFTLMVDYGGEDIIQEMYRKNNMGKEPLEHLPPIEKERMEEYVGSVQGLLIKEPGGD